MRLVLSFSHCTSRNEASGRIIAVKLWQHWITPHGCGILNHSNRRSIVETSVKPNSDVAKEWWNNWELKRLAFPIVSGRCVVASEIDRHDGGRICRMKGMIKLVLCNRRGECKGHDERLIFRHSRCGADECDSRSTCGSSTNSKWDESISCDVNCSTGPPVKYFHQSHK